jgi:aromatic-L-amino-acid/L-tryptophan decarboxylase
MDVRALREQIADDRAAGLTPACVAATAGTVNTGAIDALSDIADLCEAENVWFHIDASYGGPAVLLPYRVDSRSRRAPVPHVVATNRLALSHV